MQIYIKVPVRTTLNWSGLQPPHSRWLSSFFISIDIIEMQGCSHGRHAHIWHIRTRWIGGHETIWLHQTSQHKPLKILQLPRSDNVLFNQIWTIHQFFISHGIKDKSTCVQGPKLSPQKTTSRKWSPLEITFPSLILCIFFLLLLPFFFFFFFFFSRFFSFYFFHLQI